MAGDPVEATDRPWGILWALSDAAWNRSQGQHMFLTRPEHTLGRVIKSDRQFVFDSPSISGRHCKIFRKSITGEDGQCRQKVFIKDSSSNGTYVNGRRLRKDTPEVRVRDGDVISLATLPEPGSFTYVFRDTSCGFKRNADELSRTEGGKRMKTFGLDGQADEVRQKLELECTKCGNLSAAAQSESVVKEAVDQCTLVFNEKLADLQAELSARTAAMEEAAANGLRQEDVIMNLHKNLKAAEAEAGEASNNFKADKEAMETQLENEKNRWRKEREEFRAQHKAAIGRIQANAKKQKQRQAQAFFRKQKHLEDKLTKLKKSMLEYSLRIESLRKQLKDERESRMNFERRAQDLQIQRTTEQDASLALRQELEKAREDLQLALTNLEACKNERNVANATIASLQTEKEEILNRLQHERKRRHDARNNAVLRETQVRAFRSTTERIANLQKKQQLQLQALMQALKDDGDAADCSKAAGLETDAGETPDAKQVQGETFPSHASSEPIEIPALHRVADVLATQTEAREDTLVATQLNVTQGDATLCDADQVTERRRQDSGTAVEARLAASPGEQDREATVGSGPRTPRNEADDSQSQQPSEREDGRPRQFPKSSLCTADLLASEALESDGGNAQEEESQPVVASQVGNSDSLQLREFVRDDRASTGGDVLASQSSAMVVKQQPKIWADEDSQ